MRSIIRDPRLPALAALLLAACLIGRRSEEFACESSDDCDQDRGCVNGYCVRLECPDECTCQDPLPDRTGYATCIIDCPGASCRGEDIQCPEGMACTVRCDSSMACDRVDCSDATSCDIQCTGSNSCTELVTCGPGPCKVTCSGNGSCDGGVSCSSSCSCDVTCGASACSTPATCPSTTCDTGLGCTPSPVGTCNRC